MKIILQHTIALFIFVVFNTSSKLNGQTIYLLNGNDTLKTNSLGVKVNLLLTDTLISLNIGQNQLKDIHPKDCKAIQVIYLEDTLNFWKIFQYRNGTNATLLAIMKKGEPDYSQILKTNWTIIIDQNPCRNKDLAPLLEKMPESKEKNKTIIAMRTIEYMWTFVDTKL
jgi:hypothetical protein